MKQGILLIVDDNPSVLASMELFLKHKFQRVIAVKNPNTIPATIRKENPDIVLLDMNFTAGINTGNEGFYWMQKIKKIDPTIEIILITAYGDVELAVKAIKEGATDFILKPWNNSKLLTTLQTALKLKQSRDEIKILHQRQHQLKENINSEYGNFIGRSSKIVKLFRDIRKIAKTEANVLITGENGTGKELVAFEFHRQSGRKDEVFIKVDLGSLSESIFESELFGHKKGSFTGAVHDRTGKFETASKGTLMLDEIGNLSITQQNKLLTALQSKRITPLGSNKEITIDFRLICATNKDPEEMVSKNLFREDLLYRINTIHIHIPPLRERGDDIPVLTEHFLKYFSSKYEKQNIKLSTSALDALEEYTWPGNVRELKHTIEKAVIMCGSNIIKPEDLQLKSLRVESIQDKKILSLEEGEKLIIQQALNNNNGKIVDTAKELKIGRQTLYRKIEKYNLKTKPW